jgi:molybdate transport system ATP-binding protein
VRHRRTTCARQQLAQLVLDIDSKEGALLHVATHMIERNLTEVRSILIGLGDFKAHMTAMGNVMAAMSHLPRAERRTRAQALIEMVHLAGLEQRKPAELSGGQQQRVALARALARDPLALLLDEPFSAVDRPTRRGLHDELQQLRQEVRIPILLVTHDLDEAVRLADRLAVLDHGALLQIGPPAEVVAGPVSQRVRDVLDLPGAVRS